MSLHKEQNANNNARQLVTARLRKELLGPAGEENEIILGSPSYRYITGMLFPTESASETMKPSADIEQEQDSADTDSDFGSDTAIASAYDLKPSSMGLSFFLKDASSIALDISAATYSRRKATDLIHAFSETPNDKVLRDFLLGLELDEEILNLLVADEKLSSNQATDIIRHLELPGGGSNSKKQFSGLKKSTFWRRTPLQDNSISLSVPKKDKPGISKADALGNRAVVQANFRPFGAGHLATVTLLNAAATSSSEKIDASIEKMLFQSSFQVCLIDGSIGAYPETKRLAMHDEDAELAFTYMSRSTYGIGHGCAASWVNPPEGNNLKEIAADPMPELAVRGLTNDIAIDDPIASGALQLAWLADDARSIEELGLALSRFVDAYQSWVDSQQERADVLETNSPAHRIVSRQRRGVERMRRGIQAILQDEGALKAFRLSQKTMALQFAWARRRRSGPFDLGAGKTAPIEDHELDARWFPFQLGYQLLAIESLLNHDSEDRELVDLLWFPTGGGKTEAYLALAAFEMIHRRLRYSDSGPAVIMRYTLRLLTAQQFDRCATMVGALESLRKEKPGQLGESPFRLGFWVGGGLTPNRLDSDSGDSPGAAQLVELLLEEDSPDNPFQLRQCPRCGTRIVPLRKSRKEEYGVEANASGFRMWCPDGDCELHSEIPVSVVDDDLFHRPPSFLIGTIDKFARMAWDARSRALLGLGSGGLPATLIIQDELHLINGPLGSIAGGYEAAIDTALSQAGVRPKYLASTATIQRSTEQCRALYGRDDFIFPPTGLDVGDAFFSKEDLTDPGRLFIGLMGNGLYSSLTTLVQASAATAQAVMEIPAERVNDRDSYWTQVIYHNSKHELGKTTTMLRDDVRTRLELLGKTEETRRTFENVEELSANLKGSMIAEAIERLELEWSPSKESDAIDAVACTNMISVGVDIGRLGIMLMKGQPKSTSEYIQATSRVGRQRHSRPPGIVLTMYSPARPRDRSHYENFQAYHGSLYRHVEPSSVTPFSPRARERTIHAALVIALRHSLNWTENEDAALFEKGNGDQLEIVTQLRERIEAACFPDEIDDTHDFISQRIEEWSREVLSDDSRPLRFAGKKQFRPLLVLFENGTKQDGWATLNSMRHVDGETPFNVRGERWR
jgi:hypothetical protein